MEEKINGFVCFQWNGDGTIATNFYSENLDRDGFAFGTAGHGGFDLLIPRKVGGCDHSLNPIRNESGSKVIREMRTGEFAVCFYNGKRVAFVFEDYTQYPYVFNMDVQQFAVLPADKDDGRQCELRVWAYNEKKREVFLALTLQCIVKIDRE